MRKRNDQLDATYVEASDGAVVNGITGGISGPRFMNDMMTRPLHRAQAPVRDPIK